MNENNDLIKKTATLEEHQAALYALLEEFDSVCKKLQVKYFLFAGTMLGAVRHQGFIPWDDDLDILMMRSDYERFLKEADTYLDKDKFYLQKEFSDHWPMFFSKLRMNGTTCLEKYHPKDKKSHQGVYIDLFPCDNASNSKVGRKLQFWASKVVIAKGLYERGYATNSKGKKIFMQICRVLPKRIFWTLCKQSKGINSDYVHVFLGASSRYEKSVFERKHFDEAQLTLFERGEFPIPKGYDALLTQLYGDYLSIPKEEDRGCKVHAIVVDLNNSYEVYENYRDNIVFKEFTRSIR